MFLRVHTTSSGISWMHFHGPSLCFVQIFPQVSLALPLQSPRSPYPQAGVLSLTAQPRVGNSCSYVSDVQRVGCLIVFIVAQINETETKNKKQIWGWCRQVLVIPERWGVCGKGNGLSPNLEVGGGRPRSRWRA